MSRSSKQSVKLNQNFQRGFITKNTFCQGYEYFLKQYINIAIQQVSVLLLNLFDLVCPSEHLGLALALNVPVFVVVTKIDMCPPNVLQDTMKLLARILKSPGCRKIPVIVQNTDDVVVSATNFVSERYVLQVSSFVTEFAYLV